MNHREKMEQYARRHGFQNYEQMRKNLLEQQENAAGRQKTELEPALAEAAVQQLEAASQDMAIQRQTAALAAFAASQELTRQAQLLLERFPQLREEGIPGPEEGGERVLAALAERKNGPEVLRYWQRMRPAGMELADAYLLKNYRELLARQGEAARQVAINSMMGRAHLLPSGGSQGEDTPVPGAVYEMYRALNPEATDQEIRKHYKRNR